MSDRFGSYVVLGEVSEGSLGRVYKARHTELDRVAAIKELSPAVRDVPGQLERLRGEATVLAGLDHPNIVALYEYSEEPDESPTRAWLAEQWVDGATLAAILDQHGSLTPEQALGVIRGAVTGLAHAHAHGVVHRDISAGNILADQQGTSMLVDFGVAAPAAAGSVVGTPAFLSPEAARGDDLTPASDVYSVAALTYLLLTGTPVFTGSAAEVVAHQRSTAAPALVGHGDDLALLLERSLSKDPALRPPDAASFLAQLEEAAARRYGAAWLQRASIAGLIGAGAGAGVGGAVGVAGTTGGIGAAETVIVDAAAGVGLPSVAATAVKVGRAKVLIAVGAAATVVVAGGTAIALASGTDDESREDGPSSTATSAPLSPTSTAVATPVVDPVVSTVPAGRWRLKSKVLTSNNPAFAEVGQGEQRVWRFRPACEVAAECGGVIRSSSGSRFSYAWDGAVLTITPPKSPPVEDLCSTDAGEKVPDTHFRERSFVPPFDLVPTGPAQESGLASRYEGVREYSTIVDQLEGNCVNSYLETGAGRPRATARYVLTPLG